MIKLNIILQSQIEQKTRDELTEFVLKLKKINYLSELWLEVQNKVNGILTLFELFLNLALNNIFNF